MPSHLPVSHITSAVSSNIQDRLVVMASLPFFMAGFASFSWTRTSGQVALLFFRCACWVFWVGCCLLCFVTILWESGRFTLAFFIFVFLVQRVVLQLDFCVCWLVLHISFAICSVIDGLRWLVFSVTLPTSHRLRFCHYLLVLEGCQDSPVHCCCSQNNNCCSTMWIQSHGIFFRCEQSIAWNT